MFAEWGWLIVPLAIAASSRVVSRLLFALVNTRFHRHDTLLMWDAQWYVSIAEHGYHGDPISIGGGIARYDIAFFPAWPFTIRVGSLGVLPTGAVAVVLANVLFLVAAVLIWRVLDERFGARIATPAIALLSFSPASFVFTMGYSESLFLCLIALFFLVPATSRLRAPLAFVAVLTRISGVAAVASSLWLALRGSGRRRSLALLAAGAGAAAFAGWWTFIALLLGDPLGFLRGSPNWNATTGVGYVLRALAQPSPRTGPLLVLVALMVAGSVLAFRRDRELGVFALTVVALGLLPGGTLGSMPRYDLAAFPAFAGLAAALGPRRSFVLVVAFVVAQYVFIGWVIGRPAQPP